MSYYPPVLIPTLTVAPTARLVKQQIERRSIPQAFVLMHRMVDESPTDALVVLARVAERLAHDEGALDSLGADALEDLFRDHAALVVERLEEGDPRDAALRSAARYMWCFEHPLKSRVDAICGPNPFVADRLRPSD